MSRLVLLFKGLGLVILCLLLFGCKPHFENHLRIAANNWIGYTPLYLAEELSLFHSSQIKMIEMPSSSEVIHAFRSGSIDVAALTLDETLTILEDQYDIRLLLVMDISDGSDVLLAKPYIDSLHDLKGKKIAVEYNAVGALVLDHALNEVGLSPRDIDMQSCNFDAHLACYEQNDAIVTFDPVKTKLMNKGAKLLYSSKQMPNVILDVLVTTQQVIDNQPEQLQALVNAYFNARTLLSDSPATAIAHISHALKIPEDELKQAFTGVKLPDYAQNHQLLTGDNPLLDDTIQRLQTTMIERNLLSRMLETEQLINPTFIENTTTSSAVLRGVSE
ncbi:ABC-type nitrate/sulfonate/bicarbonate transport system protein [Pseudoalteromonas luteoviolacea B = ATCC 29581]|nr:ABC-type nitrate/sulfonate/bicarbonate transport system protein [Pseudoalteromonas luteoviolacea B = ATCC 29581]